jgi:hypothetical protein
MRSNLSMHTFVQWRWSCAVPKAVLVRISLFELSLGMCLCRYCYCYISLLDGAPQARSWDAVRSAKGRIIFFAADNINGLTISWKQHAIIFTVEFRLSRFWQNTLWRGMIFISFNLPLLHCPTKTAECCTWGSVKCSITWLFSVIRSRSLTLYIQSWIKDEVGGGSGIFAPGLLIIPVFLPCRFHRSSNIVVVF